MSDNQLISVVIPVYKVEEYLCECVDSVINQTYKNLDIILVDDGSPDKCPAMCDEYAVKDSRVRVIHRQNGGLSAARNSGIDIARGEYITFIDSDDYVSAAYVEQLFTAMKNSGAGISQCIYTNDPGMLDDNIRPDYEIYSAHDAIKAALVKSRIARSAWGKLYSTNIFAPHGGSVRYPEGQTAEDFYTMPQLFDSAGTFALTDSIKYFYRLRDDSLWLRPFAPDKLDYYISSAFVEKYLSEKYPDLLDYVHRDSVGVSLHILRKAIQTEPDNSPVVEKIFRQIKDGDWRGFMSSPYDVKAKILIAITVFMPKKLAFKILRTYDRIKHA